jgi:sorting nexin-27
VISVPDQVAERLEPSDDSSGPSYIDYSERRSLPISIPDYQTIESVGEKFVVSKLGFISK